jgi:hypothetical protein
LEASDTLNDQRRFSLHEECIQSMSPNERGVDRAPAIGQMNVLQVRRQAIIYMKGLRNCGLNAGRIKDVFFLCDIQTCCGIHQPIHWIPGAVALVVKQPGCEV